MTVVVRLKGGVGGGRKALHFRKCLSYRYIFYFMDLMRLG